MAPRFVLAADGAAARCSAPLDATLKQRAERTIAQQHPGVTLEDKGYSIALHYRSQPALGPASDA